MRYVLFLVIFSMVSLQASQKIVSLHGKYTNLQSLNFSVVWRASNVLPGCYTIVGDDDGGAPFYYSARWHKQDNAGQLDQESFGANLNFSTQGFCAYKPRRINLYAVSKNNNTLYLELNVGDKDPKPKQENSYGAVNLRDVSKIECTENTNYLDKCTVYKKSGEELPSSTCYLFINRKKDKDLTFDLSIK